MPLPAGAGNLARSPGFVDLAAGDLRLRATSPCIEAGANADWMAGAVDMDGHPGFSINAWTWAPTSTWASPRLTPMATE